MTSNLANKEIKILNCLYGKYNFTRAALNFVKNMSYIRPQIIWDQQQSTKDMLIEKILHDHFRIQT